MAAEFNIRTESDSGGPSSFADLDSLTQRSAFRGLSVAAMFYAVVFFLAFTSEWVIQIIAEHRFMLPPAFAGISTVIAIGYALFVAFRCNRPACTARPFARMAGIFLVVAAFGIAIHAWGWEQVAQLEVGPAAWVGVWIVLYPGVVTLAPRQILVSSLLASMTVPGVAIASVVSHGVPPTFEGSPTIAIARLTVPVLICAGLAYAISYRIFRMARDVTKARQLGSYELTERIGSGGMGEVWKARHRLLARPAAVKLIRPEAIGQGDTGAAGTALRRFEREAQATALLTSPHSIMLYDFGIATDGAFYYVMELLEGRDLKSLIQDNGPLEAERAVHFLRAACDSLADAHDRGLIHRDVKPANLFTCRRGQQFDFLKVLDFGLVKTISEPGEAITQLTREGVTSGTPGFMAPEMVTGEAVVDGRADIYALGCVAHWLLTGQLVFDGKSPMSILVQHVKEDPPTIASRTEVDIPRRLEEIVRACLAKEPGARPCSARELGDELADLASTLPAWTHTRAETWWRTNLPNLHAAPLVVGPDTAAPTVINA